MKKLKLINSFLIIAIIFELLLLPYLIYLLKTEIVHFNTIESDIKSLQYVTDEDMHRIYSTLFYSAMKKSVFNITAQSIFILVTSCLSVLNIFTFVYLNPRLFRRSTYTDIKAKAAEGWAQNRAERLARKAAKAEADKQKRIEELQAELDELKDTNSNP